MILYIHAGELVINLLQYYSKANDGIDLNLIQRYCNAIKESVYSNGENELTVTYSHEPGHIMLYFQNYSQAISDYVYKNRYQILTVLDKYYKTASFDFDMLSSNIGSDDELKNILKSVAEKLDT